MFRVKLVGTNKPIAQAVLDIQKRYSERVPARLHDKILGGMSVEEIYIYPSPVSAAD